MHLWFSSISNTDEIEPCAISSLRSGSPLHHCCLSHSLYVTSVWCANQVSSFSKIFSCHRRRDYLLCRVEFNLQLVEVTNDHHNFFRGKLLYFTPAAKMFCQAKIQHDLAPNQTIVSLERPAANQGLYPTS